MVVIQNVKGIRGLAWPWKKSTGGIPEQVFDEDAIKANLLVLYSTQPGDDKTAPTFGLDLVSFVFETVGTLLDALIKAEVVRATDLWEPRVQIVEVDSVTKEEDDGGTIVDITVTYSFMGIIDTVEFDRKSQ
jgi:phage baseplate assembly protein W